MAIELFRRQTSRSSSPPDMRLAAGTTASERDARSVKSDDDIQTTLSNIKKGEEEERTQQDDSNVRMLLQRLRLNVVSQNTLLIYQNVETSQSRPSDTV